MESISPKLTPAQTRVMHLRSHGWEAQPGAGPALLVNGARLRNVDTLQVLYRAGFAMRDDRGYWRTTSSGLAL